MAACTIKSDGTLVRWHADLSECPTPECNLRHVERDELFADMTVANLAIVDRPKWHGGEA